MRSPNGGAAAPARRLDLEPRQQAVAHRRLIQNVQVSSPWNDPELPRGASKIVHDLTEARGYHLVAVTVHYQHRHR